MSEIVRLREQSGSLILPRHRQPVQLSALARNRIASFHEGQRRIQQDRAAVARMTAADEPQAGAIRCECSSCRRGRPETNQE